MSENIIEVKNRFTGDVMGEFDISPGANLSEANLSKADLSGANLSKAYLSGANLFRADLSEADLSGANLTGANLSEADIDFSCWPLWCGTANVIYGERNTKLLGAHWLVNALPVLEENNIPVSDELIEFLNGFHRIESGEFPKIERKK